MIETTRQYRELFAAFNRRDWKLVACLAGPLLGRLPDDPDTNFIAGLAELELGRLGKAIRFLRQALSLKRSRSEFSANLARALSMAGDRHEAMAMAKLAMRSEPLSPTTLDIIGAVYSNLNAHSSALEAFRRATAMVPDYAPFRYNFATSLVGAGAFDEAEREIELCLSLDPFLWRAHLALAHLRQQTPKTHHLARLGALLAEHSADTDARAILHLAMAKEYEDLGHYAESFEHLTKGKKAARHGITYVIDQDKAVFNALESVASSVFDGLGHSSSEPIFVFGMPRTGTTLVERILTRHPEISSVGELPDFGIALRQAWGSDRPLHNDPNLLGTLAKIDWHHVGEAYLSRARAVIGSGLAPRHFVDKLPHNFLYAGFIAKCFPNAKLICLRRNPIDTCLSNFRQLFSRKLPYYNYSFDLLDTGTYYVMFNRLMKHWSDMFPGRILYVSYESLIDQQKFTSQQIINFCGLEWSELCMSFYKNELPVSNASAIQVRSMIYSSGVNRWHNYRAQLRELQALLAQSGVYVE